MTIFKDEFDTRFVIMFTVLLFLKVFHWLCMDRVDSVSSLWSFSQPRHHLESLELRLHLTDLAGNLFHVALLDGAVARDSTVVPHQDSEHDRYPCESGHLAGSSLCGHGHLEGTQYDDHVWF